MPTTASSPAAWNQLLDRFSKWFTVERMAHDRIEEVCAFFKRAYADQPVAEHFQDDAFILKRWRWLNEQNPTSLDGGIPAWICRHNGRIVGHLAVLPAEAVARGKTLPLCWGRDLIVAPEVRHLGVGPLLVMTAAGDVRRPFLVAGVSEEAYAIYDRLGFVDGGLIPLYLKVYEPSRLLETLPWTKLKRTVASGLVKTVQFWADRKRPAVSALTVKPLARFDERFDQWWSHIEGAFPCVVRRTSATMTWRYHHHPKHQYHCFSVSDQQALRGVLVVRHGRSRGMSAGFMSEMLAHPDDQAAIDRLVGVAQEFFTAAGRERPVFIRCSMLQPAFAKGLARAGFLRAPSSTHWMWAPVGGSSDSDGLAGRDDWFLNAGDSDIDML